MREIIGQLVCALDHLAEATRKVMEHEPTFRLVMTGSEIGIAKAIVGTTIDRLRKEEEEPCEKS